MKIKNFLVAGVLGILVVAGSIEVLGGPTVWAQGTCEYSAQPNPWGPGFSCEPVPGRVNCDLDYHVVHGTDIRDCWCRCDPDSGGPGGTEERGITNPLLSSGLQNMSGTTFVSNLLQALISLGFIAAAVVFIFMFLTGGIKWITSAGDKNQVETARGQITQAVVGLIIVFSLYIIIGGIERIFGINLRLFNLPKVGE